MQKIQYSSIHPALGIYLLVSTRCLKFYKPITLQNPQKMCPLSYVRLMLLYKIGTTSCLSCHPNLYCIISRNYLVWGSCESNLTQKWSETTIWGSTIEWHRAQHDAAFLLCSAQDASTHPHYVWTQIRLFKENERMMANIYEDIISNGTTLFHRATAST